MTADELVAMLHGHPKLAVEAFHRIKIAEEWIDLKGEWRRYSLCWLGELDEHGKEMPVGRVFKGHDEWCAVHVLGTRFPSQEAARKAEDAVLLRDGWSLVDPLEVLW